MAGVITRLVYQKHNPQRVNVFLDGAYALAVADAVAARLKVGQWLSDTEIAEMQGVDLTARAYDKALRYLAPRPRSGAEVETRLLRADVPASVVTEVMLRLQEQGYVDDTAFATWWIDNRQRFSPRGTQALRFELVQKGVDRTVIDEALTLVDSAEQALAAGRTKIERWRHLPHDEFYKKMLGHLQRRGFTYATARTVTDELWRTQGGQPADESDP